MREPSLGDMPLIEGMVFHHTALYELMHLAVLFSLMTGMVLWSRRRGAELVPGTLVGLFMIWYGLLRFATDIVRVNDGRVAGMTGGQWLSVVLVPSGIFVLGKVRPELARLMDTSLRPGAVRKEPG